MIFVMIKCSYVTIKINKSNQITTAKLMKFSAVTIKISSGFFFAYLLFLD